MCIGRSQTVDSLTTEYPTTVGNLFQRIRRSLITDEWRGILQLLSVADTTDSCFLVIMINVSTIADTRTRPAFLDANYSN